MTNEQYHSLIRPYTDAMNLILARLDILNHQVYDKDEIKPIHSITSRIKTKESIEKKLQRKHSNGSVRDAKSLLQDIAGVRVVCFFEQDIRHLKNALKKQSDLILIKEKDYITNPKPNGYRSYHMIIEIPVFFSDSKKPIRVEVQIRTIAMDFWASLDHQLKYKKSFIDDNGEISEELKQCAEVIAGTDMKMLEIRKKIEAQGVTVRRD